MEGLLILGVMVLVIAAIFFLVGSLVDEDGKAAIIGLILIAAAGILLGILMYACNKCSEQPWQRDDPYTTHTIVALSDGNEINGKIRGSRYCMSGYINEKFTYVYGYKTYGGGMKIQKAGADSTVVYFRDDMEPCAKWYEETRSYWFVEETRYTCDIFVPTDSLEANITIDLK